MVEKNFEENSALEVDTTENEEEVVEVKSKRLKAKDFIIIGIFTAILVALEFAFGMLGFIHPYVVAGYVVILPIVSAIPLLLFYSKIEKFGMITIMSALIAIIMFVTGMGWIGAPVIIALGLIADLIAKKGNYKSFKLILLSNAILNLWVCANYIPILVTGESYKEDLIKGGYSAEYCEGLFNAINYKTIGILVLVCFVVTIIATLIARLAVKKHFEKAGII